jgi:peptidoglycan/LPS O-acetylase OafA/YrhL
MATMGSVSVLIAFLGISSKLLPGWAINLGRISYGLYVFHGFAINIFDRLEIGHRVSLPIASHPLRACVSGGVDLGLSLGLTLLVAATSYRYFETPFLKMKNRHAIIKSQPATPDNKIAVSR